MALLGEAHVGTAGAVFEGGRGVPPWDSRRRFSEDCRLRRDAIVGVRVDMDVMYKAPRAML